MDRDFKKAQRSYLKASQADGSDADIWMNLFKTAVHLGERSKAKKFGAKAVAIEPGLSPIVDTLIKKTKTKIAYDSLPTVIADPDDLTQIFEALISNAIKFRSKTPPRVQIRAERKGPSWEISVQDNGIGIESDQTERIFGVFQRIHTEEEHTGSGIGLSVCKKLVERQGGNIRVESKPGEGSTFHFTMTAHDAAK